MKPSEVPDDLARTAEEAWVQLATTAPPGAYDHEAIRRHILAAVLPAHERQVRERVAAERLREPDSLTVYHASEVLYGRCDTCGEIRWHTERHGQGFQSERSQHCRCCTHPHDLAPGGYEMPRGEVR